jgi:hypothetical protein
MAKTRTDTGGRAWSPEAAPYATSWRDTRWKSGEYELEFRVYSPGDTPDTGWYLYGVGVFGEFMARKLDEAITEAGQAIARHADARSARPDHEPGGRTPPAPAPHCPGCDTGSNALTACTLVGSPDHHACAPAGQPGAPVLHRPELPVHPARASTPHLTQYGKEQEDGSRPQVSRDALDRVAAIAAL